jgi:NADPH-dependent curcumin reductase CurA
VGGEHLNACLPRMRLRGRIVVCGMISTYNNDGAISECVNTLANMMYNRLTMTGFIVWDHVHLRERFLSDMRGWIAQGQVRWEETVYEGLENAPAALIGLFTGQNLGKMLVRIS